MSKGTERRTLYWSGESWTNIVSNAEFRMDNITIYSFKEYNYVEFFLLDKYDKPDAFITQTKTNLLLSKSSDMWVNIDEEDLEVTKEYGYLGHVYKYSKVEDGLNVIQSARIATEFSEYLFEGLDMYAVVKNYGSKHQIQAMGNLFYIPTTNIPILKERVEGKLGGLFIHGIADAFVIEKAIEINMNKRNSITLAEIAIRDLSDSGGVDMRTTLRAIELKKGLSPITLPQGIEQLMAELDRPNESARAELIKAEINQTNEVSRQLIREIDDLVRMYQNRMPYHSLAFEIGTKIGLQIPTDVTIDHLVSVIQDKFEELENKQKHSSTRKLTLES